MNESGTDDGFSDVSAPEGQAEQSVDQPAVSDQEESTDQQPETEAQEEDEDLSWASKKGVNLDDKKAVAKMLRNADRKVSEAGAQKSQLNDMVKELNTPGPDDDVVTELRTEINQLRSMQTAMSYLSSHPEDAKLETEAAQMLNGLKESDPEFARSLARNLPALFKLVRAEQDSSQVESAKAEGRKEEREHIAKKQRASAPTPAATKSTFEVDEKDPFMEGFNNPW